MSLTIPPLPPFQPQWPDFQVWWQLAKTAIENAQNDLSDQVAAIAAAQAAADAAAADAAAAQTTATTANTNAAAAQTTANSKAKVTRASSAPASPSVNDVWVDTSSSPVITKTWTGSAWSVAATEGADLASNVTNNTLDNVTDSSTRKAFLSTERTKLTGIAAGATVGADLSSNVTNNTLANVTDTASRKALATNAVQTSYIQANAVTNSVSAYTAGSIAVPATSTWTDIQSVTITATGQPIEVQACFYAGNGDAAAAASTGLIQFQIVRDSTVIYGPVDFGMYFSATASRGTGTNSCAVLDQPASGSRTYKIQAWAAAGTTCDPLARSLVVTETKR